MSQNLETMIITSVRNLNEAHQRFAQDSEKLRERLGTTTLLIELARKALSEENPAKADYYLDLAEKATAGSKEIPFR